jgi:hypothetical protein
VRLVSGAILGLLVACGDEEGTKEVTLPPDMDDVHDTAGPTESDPLPTDSGAETDRAGDTGDTGDTAGGEDSGPGGDSADDSGVPGDTGGVPDSDVPVDRDVPADSDVPTDSDVPVDTDPPVDSDVPGDSDVPIDSDASADTADTAGDSGDSGDTGAEPGPSDSSDTGGPDTGLVAGDWVCRHLVVDPTVLDGFQAYGDHRVLYCHRNADGSWSLVESDTHACAAHARLHVGDQFATTGCAG